MSRPYWVEVSVYLADDAEQAPDDLYAAPGRSAGICVDNVLDASWVPELMTEMMQRELDRAAAEEVQRDRRKAAPFWKRWLGGV